MAFHENGDFLVADLIDLIPRLDDVLPAHYDVPPGTPYSWLVQWTCPKCGERVGSVKPNTLKLTGYIHIEKIDGSPCGGAYNGPRFGLRLWIGIDRHDLEAKIAELEGR